jgi:hypothetical protein
MLEQAEKEGKGISLLSFASYCQSNKQNLNRFYKYDWTSNTKHETNPTMNEKNRQKVHVKTFFFKLGNIIIILRHFKTYFYNLRQRIKFFLKGCVMEIKNLLFLLIFLPFLLKASDKNFQIILTKEARLVFMVNLRTDLNDFHLQTDRP